LAIVFTGLFFFVLRLSVFVVFFSAVLCGGAVCGLSRRLSWLIGGCLIPFALVLDFERENEAVIHRAIDNVIGYEHQPAASIRRKALDDSSLVIWVRENTPLNSAFMSRFSVAPLILAYADRAIVTQPKFEVPGSREKVRRILEAFYGDEESLAALCEEFGAEYWLLDGRATLDGTHDSERYSANALRLATSTPAYRMQFVPESLTRFQLVYQNRYYRLFKLVRDAPGNDTGKFPYEPFYDIGRFGGQTGNEPFFDDTYTTGVIKQCRRAEDLLAKGARALVAGSHSVALNIFDRALEINPSIHGGHGYRGVALMEMGRLQEAAEEISEEATIHSSCPMAAYQLGHIRFLTGDWKQALRAFRHCYELDPDFPGVLERIRQTQQAMQQSVSKAE
jgi:tetratricopeptide (TPR) repeat protein